MPTHFFSIVDRFAGVVSRNKILPNTLLVIACLPVRKKKKLLCCRYVGVTLLLFRLAGDHSYKLQTDLSAHEQQITAVPDVRQTPLTE